MAEDVIQEVLCGENSYESNGTFSNGSIVFNVSEGLSLDVPCDLNSTNSSDPLAYHLTFNDDSVREIVAYSVLFVLAAMGNVLVFISLLRNRRRKSRIKVMIMHLSIADLIVTFVMIPLEIAWRITVQWIAGDIMCRVMLFLRAFGPYLSSMVLICISFDRYFAIVHPLKVNDAHRRGKIMLFFAWIVSILCSVPQSVIFHVQKHPEYPQFEQCVSFGFFPTEYHKMAYNIFCLLAVYGVPLLIIVICYSRILWELSQRSKDTEDNTNKENQHVRMRLRRSDISHIERARTRTLKMTVIIVLAFFWCWTPYVVMVLWYIFDPESAEKVDSIIQSSLFMFAVSNSCVNPLVYGSYAINFRTVVKNCFVRRNCRLTRQLPTQVTRTSPIGRWANGCARGNARRHLTMVKIDDHPTPLLANETIELHEKYTEKDKRVEIHSTNSSRSHGGSKNSGSGNSFDFERSLN